jgi:SAM-dependent methyltransferase
MDWGIGHYEHVAGQLGPAAATVVEHCRPQPGEHVVDLGCGTGNAALLAARAGCRTTGIDPSPRLLDVARAEASARGVDAEFLTGQAEDMPIEDGSIDAIVSVFGLIFCADAEAAAAEIDRVLRRPGRLVFSAWLPGGPIGEQARRRRDAVAAALATPSPVAPFAWHDVGAVTALLAPHGFSVTVDEHVLAFTASSARAFATDEFEHHPGWVDARGVLEGRSEWQRLCDEVIAIFVAANEDPAAFRVSSEFALVTATR